MANKINNPEYRVKEIFEIFAIDRPELVSKFTNMHQANALNKIVDYTTDHELAVELALKFKVSSQQRALDKIIEYKEEPIEPAVNYAIKCDSYAKLTALGELLETQYPLDKTIAALSQLNTGPKAYALAIMLYSGQSVENSIALASQITLDAQAEALKVIIKHQQKATDALLFTAKTSGDGNYEFQALLQKLPAKLAMMVDNFSKLSCIKSIDISDPPAISGCLGEVASSNLELDL
jgi:hypothetical protein